MNNLQDVRPVIYPGNIDKANQIVETLNMKSISEMVNYLIECIDVQQLTKITITHKTTHKSIIITRTSGKYNPRI